MHIIVKILIILTVTTVVSCKRADSLFPIPKDKLIQTLADIHIAETVYDNETLPMKDSLAKLYYPQIFEKNGITAKDFDSSMAVMSSRPGLMSQIYKDVMNNINKRKFQDSTQLAQ